MCGIVGVSGSEPISWKWLESAVISLSARGPDGSGQWLSDDATVGLGHARLATRDLGRGQQPLHVPGRPISGVFNGEFYGITPLRAELQRRGYQFHSHSDSAVALYLYAEFGPDCVRFLRGEFALIIWDGEKQTLLALRDRFGIKPLYYARQGEALWLASKPSALWALGVSPDWDTDCLAQISGFQYPLPTQSLFAGIQALPPGQGLQFHAGQLQLFSYWDLDYPPAAELQPQSESALLPELRQRLEEAVFLRREADVPLCSYLSAGLDSSLISALLHQQGRSPVFCVGFPGWQGDEVPQAQATAAALGLDLRSLSLDLPALEAAFADTVRVTEGTCINPHVVARRLLCRTLRSEGYKVVLTGEGADELFGGYAHLLEDLYPGSDRHQGLKGMHLPLGQGPDLSLLEQEWGTVPTFLKAKSALGQRLRSLFKPEFLQSHDELTLQRGLLAAFPTEQLQERHPLHRSLYLWIKLGLAGYILPTVGDGAEMAEGVEGRLPFLDHLLFERVRGIPPEQLMAPGQEKALLRRLSQPYLPDFVRARTKVPFLAPSLLTLRMQQHPESLRAFQERYFPEPLPNFIDPRALQERLAWLALAPPEAHQSWEPPLLLLSSFCHLQHIFSSKRSFHP